MGVLLSNLARKKLLLHFGCTKTGSTALQNMLLTNRHLLKDHGITYFEESMHHSSIQSGNGERLGIKLRQNASSAEIKKLLIPHLTSGGLSIISHEGLSTLPLDKIKLLFKCLEELEVDFGIVLYVRAPVPFYASSYNQGVKRHGYAMSFAEYIETYSWEHVNTLRRLDELRPNAEVRVVLYDAVTNELTKSFWENVYSMFGNDVRDLIPDDHTVHNPSLDLAQINLLLAINQLFNETFSILISDFLIDGIGSSHDKSTVSPEISAIISARHEQDIQWINRTFLSKNSTAMSILADYQTNEPFDSSSYPDSSSMLQVILFLLRNFDEIIYETQSPTIRSLRRKFSKIPSHDKMPDGTLFDNYYYLLENLDVLETEVTPLEHFLRWGRDEGRSWRFTSDPLNGANYISG